MTQRIVFIFHLPPRRPAGRNDRSDLINNGRPPANENHHAFGNLSTIDACPLGLAFIPFRPLSEKVLIYFPKG